MGKQVVSWNGEQLLSPKQVCAITSLSRTSVHRLAKADRKFPKPVSLSARRIAFKASEIRAYVESRQAHT